MKKITLFLIGLGMTLCLSSCFGPDMFCDVLDPCGLDVMVIHDGPGPHHPAPEPAPHFGGPGYHW